MYVDESSAAAVLLQCGSTALIRAAMCGSADDVRLLLSAGADKEAKNKVCCRSFCLNFQFYFNERKSIDLLKTTMERQRKNDRCHSLVVSDVNIDHD